jgi:hypothetical protein
MAAILLLVPGETRMLPLEAPGKVAGVIAAFLAKDLSGTDGLPPSPREANGGRVPARGREP